MTDGYIYKTQISKTEGNILTFLMNSDGISVCNKSNLTLWPVFLIINEIPKHVRFCFDNIIIAGLSVGNSKPNFNIFLKPIVHELQKLERGINLSLKDSYSDLFKCFVLYGVFDKPARASLLNITNSNGAYGCLKCLQTGKNIRTNKSNLFANY